MHDLTIQSLLEYEIRGQHPYQLQYTVCDRTVRPDEFHIHPAGFVWSFLVKLSEPATLEWKITYGPNFIARMGAEPASKYHNKQLIQIDEPLSQNDIESHAIIETTRLSNVRIKLVSRVPVEKVWVLRIIPVRIDS